MRFLLVERPAKGINIFDNIVPRMYDHHVPNLMDDWKFRPTIVSGSAQIFAYPGASNGAANPITVLRGNSLTRMRWAGGSIPLVMTMCSVSRCIADANSRDRKSNV